MKNCGNDEIMNTYNYLKKYLATDLYILTFNEWSGHLYFHDEVTDVIRHLLCTDVMAT